MVPPAVPGSWGHSAKGGIFSRSETDLMTQCFLYMHLFSEDLRIKNVICFSGKSIATTSYAPARFPATSSLGARHYPVFKVVT